MNRYTWDQLSVGLSEEFEVLVTDAMMAGFLATTGDENPLHVDRIYAEGRGFKSRVVYGLLTASFYSTLAGVYLPGESCLLHGLRVDFHAPVYVGDRLRVRGTVAHMSKPFQQLEIACDITNQEVNVVSRGKLRVGLERRQDP